MCWAHFCIASAWSCKLVTRFCILHRFTSELCKACSCNAKFLAVCISVSLLLDPLTTCLANDPTLFTFTCMRSQRRSFDSTKRLRALDAELVIFLVVSGGNVGENNIRAPTLAQRCFHTWEIFDYQTGRQRWPRKTVEEKQAKKKKKKEWLQLHNLFEHLAD